MFRRTWTYEPPIQIAPLERQQFARAHPRAKSAEEPWVPVRHVVTRHLKEGGDFIARQRIDLRLRIVCGPDVAPEPQCWIPRQELVFDGLTENGAQRTRDPAHRGSLQALGPAGSHQLSATQSTYGGDGTSAKRRNDVLFEMALIEADRAGLQNSGRPARAITLLRARGEGRGGLSDFPAINSRRISPVIGCSGLLPR